MCGFAGYINNYATFDKMAVIKAMADRIVHRGPDDAHYYVDDDISLGFPSSTSRAAASRSSTRTAASSCSSTARSTTTSRSARIS